MEAIIGLCIYPFLKNHLLGFMRFCGNWERIVAPGKDLFWDDFCDLMKEEEDSLLSYLYGGTLFAAFSL